MGGVKLVKRREAEEKTTGVVEGLEGLAETHDLEVELGSGAKLTASAAEESISLKLGDKESTGTTESRGTSSTSHLPLYVPSL